MLSVTDSFKSLVVYGLLIFSIITHLFSFFYSMTFEVFLLAITLIPGIFYWYLITKIFMKFFANLFIKVLFRVEGLYDTSKLIFISEHIENPLASRKLFAEFCFAPMLLMSGIVAYMGKYLTSLPSDELTIIVGLLIIFMTLIEAIIIIPIYLLIYSSYRIYRTDSLEIKRFASTIMPIINAVAGFGVIYRILVTILEYPQLAWVLIALLIFPAFIIFVIILVYGKYVWISAIKTMNKKIETLARKSNIIIYTYESIVCLGSSQDLPQK